MTAAISPVVVELFASGAFLVEEIPLGRSRDVVFFDNTTGATDLLVEAGTVYAAAPPTASAQAAAGNTGNGTIGNVTASTAPGLSGAYTVALTGPAGFTVAAPDGTALPPGTVGTPYLDAVGFTLSAGATPFVAGDGFTVLLVTGLQPMVVPRSGNTGSGSMANLSGLVSAPATLGNYVVTTTGTGNTFSVTSPGGGALAQGTVGTPYQDQVGFTIAAGSSPFAPGDSFVIAVRPGGANVAAWDGTQPVAGIIASTRYVSAGSTMQLPAIVRAAEVVMSGLRFPRAPSAAAQQRAVAQLATLGIIARPAV